jgi:hypothetical protein
MSLAFVASVTCASIGSVCSVMSFSHAYRCSQLSHLNRFAKPVDGNVGIRISQINHDYSMMGLHDGNNFVNYFSYKYPRSIESDQKSFNDEAETYATLGLTSGAVACGFGILAYGLKDDK